MGDTAQRDTLSPRDGYLSGVDADTFDPAGYLASFPERLLLDPEGRRVLTRVDPLLFALTYFRHHLRSDETGGALTLSRFHLDLCQSARQWIRADLGAAEAREAWVAPRGAGKSTWTFCILPAWAMAHGWRRFVAAFADSGPQAQQHLASLKREFDTNALLRCDYPDLCNPAKRPSGATVSDNQNLYVSRSGLAFLARGIDSSTLGAKVGNQRPDLLLFDDVEPDESNYSPYQKVKRLHTIVNAVFPMNLSAVVLLVGTVTMSGSIVHDVVRQVTDAGSHDLPAWPQEEKIRARYYPALYADADGVERSLWPARWSADYLRSVRHTVSFALNMMNNPRGADGDYWTRDDFRYATLGTQATRWILEVDPAVTTKGSSDWTGLAVVGYRPPHRDGVDGLADWLRDRGATLGLVEVAHAEQVKLVGEPLRDRVLRILGDHPRIKYVRVEVNQAGELWETIFHHLPVGVKLRTHVSTTSKEVRFAEALDYYQRRQVVHREPLRVAEEQMTGFPRMAHDDVADAVVGAVRYFLSPKERRIKACSTVSSYL